MKKGDLVRVCERSLDENYHDCMFCRNITTDHGYLWIILDRTSAYWKCKSISTGHETSFTSGELEKANEEG